MANVKFSRKEFEKHIKITKEIEEKITMFGPPLEKLDDNDVEIEIFPNRPDLLSFQGYIRALKAFIGKEVGLKKYKVEKPEKNYDVIISSNLENIRPFTACSIVKGIKFDDEKIRQVIDVQEKIHATFGRNRKKIAIGIYPLEKITLPIRFEARKPEDIKFIPLEEAREMNGLQVLQRTSTGREYAHLLKDYDKFPVFIDANNEILSMPPIINSHKTGKITEQTTDVFIECSGYHFQSLKTTLNILVTMLADMGGKIYQMNLKYKKPEITPNLEPDKLKIKKEDAEKLLGIKLEEKQIKNFLEKMGYEYDSKTSIVSIPAWRTDILHPVDIYEDIAIAYGYDKFMPEIPEISTIGEENKNEIIKRKIAEILTGLGMLEISTFHLTKKEDQFSNMNNKVENAIEVLNSKTDYNLLKKDLLHSTLRVLGENIDCEYPQKIFEIGRVFLKDEKQETGILEKDNLALALAPGNFTEAKQILEYLGRMLNLTFTLEETEHPSFIQGRIGSIMLKGEKIGVIGEILPSILKNWHIKMPVSALELDLEKVFSSL